MNAYWSRKARWIATLGVGPDRLSPANRIASWILALLILLLLASEEHARRTWRDMASDAQIGLAKAKLEISALRLAKEAK